MRITSGVWVKVQCSEVVGQKWIDTGAVVRQEIIRHIDGIEDAEIELECRCGLCNRLWEVELFGDDKGMPVCCNAAQDEWRANREAALT